MCIARLSRKLDDAAYYGNFNACGYNAKIFDAFVVIMALAFIDVPAGRRIKMVWKASATIADSIVELCLV